MSMTFAPQPCVPLLPYLADYDRIHCYLDNDKEGIKTTEHILSVFPDNAVDESVRYKSYNDINDVINGKPMLKQP
jgi:hypothetical protein